MRTIKMRYRLSSAAVQGRIVKWVHVSETIRPSGTGREKKRLLNFRDKKEALKTRFKSTTNRNRGFLMTSGECDRKWGHIFIYNAVPAWNDYCNLFPINIGLIPQFRRAGQFLINKNLSLVLIKIIIIQCRV